MTKFCDFIIIACAFASLHFRNKRIKKPLRLITLAGMLVSAVSFIAIIVTLITKLVGFTVTGWTSMICAIYFLGGVQLLGIGVIGEYVGKIYNETKARPRFIISETTFEKEKP